MESPFIRRKGDSSVSRGRQEDIGVAHITTLLVILQREKKKDTFRKVVLQ